MIFRVFLYTSALASVSFLTLDGSLVQSRILERSRELTQSYQYLAALEVLDEGLERYPSDAEIREEFQKNSELYVVHQISSGYQRVEKNPEDAEAYVDISNAFLLVGDRLKAMEVLLEGTFENRDSPILWRAIAKLESSAHRPLEAASAMREARLHESHE